MRVEGRDGKWGAPPWGAPGYRKRRWRWRGDDHRGSFRFSSRSSRAATTFGCCCGCVVSPPVSGRLLKGVAQFGGMQFEYEAYNMRSINLAFGCIFFFHALLLEMLRAGFCPQSELGNPRFDQMAITMARFLIELKGRCSSWSFIAVIRWWMSEDSKGEFPLTHATSP